MNSQQFTASCIVGQPNALLGIRFTQMVTATKLGVKQFACELFDVHGSAGSGSYRRLADGDGHL
ncbi:MAG: hypothetical protein ACQETB_11155 [Halobacteriota archaeon]